MHDQELTANGAHRIGFQNLLPTCPALMARITLGLRRLDNRKRPAAGGLSCLTPLHGRGQGHHLARRCSRYGCASAGTHHIADPSAIIEL